MVAEKFETPYRQVFVQAVNILWYHTEIVACIV